MQTLKLKTLVYWRFIPSHYLGFVDNYNKEKVICTNKNTPTTIITKTTKTTTTKIFLLFQRQYIYMLEKERTLVIYSFAEKNSLFVWFMLE